MAKAIVTAETTLSEKKTRAPRTVKSRPLPTVEEMILGSNELHIDSLTSLIKGLKTVHERRVSEMKEMIKNAESV